MSEIWLCGKAIKCDLCRTDGKCVGCRELRAEFAELRAANDASVIGEWYIDAGSYGNEPVCVVRDIEGNELGRSDNVSDALVAAFRAKKAQEVDE